MTQLKFIENIKYHYLLLRTEFLLQNKILLFRYLYFYYKKNKINLQTRKFSCRFVVTLEGLTKYTYVHFSLKM